MTLLKNLPLETPKNASSPFAQIPPLKFGLNYMKTFKAFEKSISTKRRPLTKCIFLFIA